MHYLLRRIGGAALVLSLAFIVAYVMLTALPGDAVMARYGNPDLGLSAAELAQIRTAYGADRPALLQFLDTVASFLRGDLGYSVQTGAAVSTLLAAALPSTLALALLGLLVAVTVAVVIAVAATHGG
ncbi:MAG: ABC transporter permease, partial [Brachybacterium sp.]|nr:ABC transporter permease [Brachybacterium sp.]